MSTQLLFCKEAVPVSKEQHTDLSIDTTQDYSFASGVNSVPLTATEFPLAARDYVIVFDVAEGSDWIVYEENADSSVSSDMAESTESSLSITWDAEAEEVNDLLPPPPPGRSGMKHGQGASAP